MSTYFEWQRRRALLPSDVAHCGARFMVMDVVEERGCGLLLMSKSDIGVCRYPFWESDQNIGIYSIKYIYIIKPSWCSWFSTPVDFLHVFLRLRVQFKLYNNNNNSPLEFHQTSAGCPLDFHWCLPVISSGLMVLVCSQSIGKVRWTKRSNQKCLDKHWKIIGKLQWLKSRKKSILVTLSPTESARKSSGSVKTSHIQCFKVL